MIPIQDKGDTNTTWKNAMSMGILIGKIEYWQKQYEFSFQFWEEDNNNVFINRGHVEIASFGGESTIRDILELTIQWCEKANPRFKYPESLIGKQIDLPD